MTNQDPKLNPYLIVRPIVSIESNAIETGYETIVQISDDPDNWMEAGMDVVRYTATINATLQTDYRVWVNDKIWASFSSRGQSDVQDQRWFLQATQTLASLREEASSKDYEAERAEANQVARTTFAGGEINQVK